MKLMVFLAVFAALMIFDTQQAKITEFSETPKLLRKFSNFLRFLGAVPLLDRVVPSLENPGYVADIKTIITLITILI